MGKQLVEKPEVQTPRVKKVTKRPAKVERVDGEREYHVRPLGDYEQYL